MKEKTIKIATAYGSFTKNDECYTPMYAISPILEFITSKATVWCPFDKDFSNYVKAFNSNGNKVIFSHIDDGYDFLEYEPKENYDLIISNPPFSLKRKVLNRLNELNKPFAILLPITMLNDNYMKELKGKEFLFFDKRIEYKTINKPKIYRIPFGSFYCCKDFLPTRIEFRELKRNKDEETFTKEELIELGYQ